MQNDGSPTPRVLAVSGLSFAIQGGEVIMLTADSATIREKDGGFFLYLRSAPDGAGLIYNVQPGRASLVPAEAGWSYQS
jgi:hypothetical protein